MSNKIIILGMFTLLISIQCYAQKSTNDLVTRDAPAAMSNGQAQSTAPSSISTNSFKVDSTVRTTIGDILANVLIDVDTLSAYYLKGSDSTEMMFQEFQVHQFIDKVQNPVKEKVITTLASDSSYIFTDLARRCSFYPEIGFKASSKGLSLFWAISMTCEKIVFYNDQKAVIGEKLIDPSNPIWNEIMESLFIVKESGDE